METVYILFLVLWYFSEIGLKLLSNSFRYLDVWDFLKGKVVLSDDYLILLFILGRPRGKLSKNGAEI